MEVYNSTHTGEQIDIQQFICGEEQHKKNRKE